MRIQTRLVSCFSGVAIAVLTAGSAGAVPIEVGLAAFSGSETVIDFSGLASGTPITTQYSAQGAVFSGGLYSFPIGKASNFDINLSQPGTAITIDLSSTMLRVGFDVSTQSTDDLRIAVSAYAGNTLVQTGSLDFITVGTTTRFVGIEDTGMGIDRLVLTAFPVIPGGTGRFVMDNLRLDAPVIPEPSAALLFPTGMLLAAHEIRRRRARA